MALKSGEDGINEKSSFDFISSSKERITCYPDSGPVGQERNPFLTL